MTTQEYRQQLVNNMCEICRFVENELSNIPDNVFFKYEYGFVYHHNTDYIALWYNPSNNKCTLRLNFYNPRDYRFENGNVYSNRHTYDFYCTRFVEYGDDDLCKAIEITLRRWQTLKREILSKKAEYNSVMNFQI